MNIAPNSHTVKRPLKILHLVNDLGYGGAQRVIAVAQPSLFEGFGLAGAEAMACGLPVISTDLPSISEVVDHERTGLLVSPGDPRALSKAMAMLADNPALAVDYGAIGRKRAEEMFSSRAVTQQYETLYKTLIDRT